MLLNASGMATYRSVNIVFLPCAAWSAFCVARNAGWRQPGPEISGAVVLAVLIGLHLYWPSLQFVPYLAIAPANLFLANWFARGLVPGRQPVLLQLIRLMGQRPAEDRDFCRFVAWQCLLWSVMTFATAVTAMAAAIWEPWRDELAAGLGWLVAVQMVWFVVSHLYAAHRYDRPETCWSTIRAMSSPDVWSKIRT
jgi:hypothetical protein